MICTLLTVAFPVSNTGPGTLWATNSSRLNNKLPKIVLTENIITYAIISSNQIPRNDSADSDSLSLLQPREVSVCAPVEGAR